MMPGNRPSKANQDAAADAREYPDRNAEPHHYVMDQLVLLQDPNNLNRNAKIASRYTFARFGKPFLTSV